MSTDSGGCFDTLAADTRWRIFTLRSAARVDAFVRRWKIKPGDRVLEPGCGAGRLTEVLAALTGPAGSVVAFDASPEFMRPDRASGALRPQVSLHTAAWTRCRSRRLLRSRGVFQCLSPPHAIA